MESLSNDLRYAVRRLASARGLATTAILTLAVSIGAATSIYSVVDAILLRPLPFSDPASLLQVWRVQEGHESPYLSLEAFEEWRRHDDVFAAAEPFRTRSVALLGSGEPHFLVAAEIGGGMMDLLGVPARIGRPLQPPDDTGRRAVVVLSDALWRSRFAADPGVLGRQIRVDDRSFEVVGVMPPQFRFPRDLTQLWMPLSESPASQPVNVLARLRQGVGTEQARDRLGAIAASLQQERPTRNGWQIAARPFQEQRANRSERYALYVLTGAVMVVLLIACANIANLLLVQGVAREREISVRAALGASRGRLARQLATETLVLALAGGALGIWLAMWAVDLLAAFTPRAFTFLSANTISLDGRVLLFAVTVTVLTAVVSGLTPALRNSRTDLTRSGNRTATASGHQDYVRRVFVVAQLALSLMLLIGAGLLARTFIRLTALDPGFNPGNVVTVDLSLPRWKYGTRPAQQQFFEMAAERLRAVPGVTAVTIAGGKPPTAGGISFGLRFEIDGKGVVLDDPTLLLPTAEVHPEYFAVLGIPLVAGRTFSGEDRPGGPPAIIISREMANRLWQGENPVGQRLRLRAEGRWHTVVGVVGDVYQLEYNSPRGMFAAYYPMSQSPGMTAQETLIIRTAGDPDPLVPAIRQQIWSVDPDQPLLTVQTMDSLYAEFLGVPRFQAILMGGFAIMGLTIAAVGLYGLLAYATSLRTREFGIRMALGARPADVLAIVLRHGAGLVGAGLALGVAGSLVMTRTMESLLVDVPRTDPATYAAVACALGAVTLVACLVPARRATRVDPVTALRSE